MNKKSKPASYASEYAMSAGDNAVSREQINQSIVSPETANESTYAKALEKGLDEML
ncbi:hypothetical protein [Anaerospora hongkongensis]|uniref:hypothetical protein n=1 Tax=Anaerospora hongkongensis TaxID=244830 RepID=UPI0028A1D556|nr:hypothetical protein [Anaerospora hongkongensis]